MAFANTSISDLIATGIDSRTGEIANNVLGNNPILANLKKKGRVKTASGGVTIVEELSFAENPNGGAYDGYDPLPTQPADVISAAQYDWKQYAVPVVVSGKEEMINSGREALIDLVDSRLEVAEDTMANIIETDLYSDGTNWGGKALTGLGAIVPATATASQTATVGGISRSTWSFWRSYYASTSTATAALLQAAMNTAWAGLTRGSDNPDLVIMGAGMWGEYLASVQANQRFTDPSSATLGFPTLKYMTADVYLGGGIGGVVATDTILFLNTKYLRWRPHAKRNFVALNPARRYATNQDASVQILGFMGNLTCRGSKFQGRFVSSD
jgi:hypothetical protein